jgi:hypothetical protein
MKVKLKTSLYDSKGIHVKGEVLEIETAAFNPINMVEIPEVKVEKKSAEVKTEAKKKTTTKKKV